MKISFFDLLSRIFARSKKIFRSEDGMSIVEVLIVMIAIATMIGFGIFSTGDKLMIESRVRNIVTSVNVCMTGYNEFLKSYGLPGDFDSAKKLFDGVNGDGDGKIGHDPFDVNGDSFKFWSHLGITGSIPLRGPFHPDKVVIGENFIKLPYGATIGVWNNPYEKYDGLWLIISDTKKSPVIPYKAAMKVLQELGGHNSVMLLKLDGTQADDADKRVIILVKLSD